MDKIRIINDQVSSATSVFESFDTDHGAFWFSRNELNTAQSYSSEPPVGIHIGAGISSLTTRYGKTKYQCNGPVVTLLNIPENNQHAFQTNIGAGQHLSCGLFIKTSELSLQSDAINTIIEQLNLNDLSFFSESIPAHYIYPLCEPMHYWSDKSSYQLVAESRALNLIALLLRQMNGGTNKLRQHQQQKIIKVRALVDQHLNKPITLNWLAKEVGLSVRTLTELFKTQFGITVNNYLIQQRMRLAMMMLEEGHTVSATAEKIGYSLHHFSNKFSQTFGVSAKTVRKCTLPKFVN